MPTKARHISPPRADNQINEVMKSQAEKWFIQQMWNRRYEIMLINERYKEHASLPNDGGAHSIHRGHLIELASELAKVRHQSFDFATEMQRVNDAYRVRR